MGQRKTLVSVSACAAAVLGFAFIANSGPLDPPGGPVAPTGRTLSEIYNAVQAVGSGGPSTVEPVAEIREVIALTVVGQAQGNIDGEDSIFGMQNVIKCFGIEHEISVPFDGPSGNPTGQTLHGAVRVSKQVDRASPLLARMATTFESGEVVLRMFKQNMQTGMVQHYYTIRLRDVVITSIEQGHTDVSRDRITHEEHVSFAYQRIEWTHEIEGTSSSADVGGGAGR